MVTYMSSVISWSVTNAELPAIDYPRVEKWIAAVVNSFGRICGDLGYLFCDDEHILEVNRRFLQHDYYTDIITFDYSRGKLVSGDMVISLDTVASNALLVSVPYEQELMRVIIHGVLHLCGINDKGPGEREVMERHENEALALWRDMPAEQ